MAKDTARVRIVDVELYPNLSPALGCVVDCKVQELMPGYYMYHVPASSLIKLGCDVDGDNQPFPFYATEVEVLNTG